jgi:hypothetical protein
MLFLTRIRSTAGVIGWRDVSDLTGGHISAAPKEKSEAEGNESAARAFDGLAW